MIHSPEHVKLIRIKSEVCATSVADLEARVTDPYIRQQLSFVRNTLGDVESIFLQGLTREERTPAREAVWLANADMALSIAEATLKIVQDAVAKYGSDVTSIG